MAKIHELGFELLPRVYVSPYQTKKVHTLLPTITPKRLEFAHISLIDVQQKLDTLAEWTYFLVIISNPIFVDIPSRKTR